MNTAAAHLTDADIYAHYKRTAPVEDVRFFLRAVGPDHPLYGVALELLTDIIEQRGKHSKVTKARYLQLHADWRGYARTTLPDYQDVRQEASARRTRRTSVVIPAAPVPSPDADSPRPTAVPRARTLRPTVNPAPARDASTGLTAGKKAALTRQARIAAGELTIDYSAAARKAVATRQARKAA